YKMSPYLGYEMTAEDLDRQYEEIHPLDSADPVGGIGPGLFFAEELIQICGVPIGLIPCALGGSSLEMWQRDFAEKKNEMFPDTLYGDLVDRVGIAGGAVKGVLWYQGESDTLPDNSKTYLERFEGFVRDLRRDLRIPDLPVITVQLATAEEMEWAGEENWDRVREAQRLASETIPHVELVASADLPRNDHVHISTDGHRVLAKRLALAASTRTTGCAPQYSVPRLGAVRADGERIEVRFAGVNGSLAVSPGASLKDCFEVPGSSVTETRISGPDTVDVVTDRSTADAREIYYGKGFRPPLGLIDDAGFAMPLFGPVAVAK
ncbi:MAG: sialate O-acetylesterase, partial [Actinomycetota bacterium]